MDSEIKQRIEMGSPGRSAGGVQKNTKRHYSKRLDYQITGGK